MDLKGLDGKIKATNQSRDKAIKQLCSLLAHMTDYQHELEEARVAKEEIFTQSKKNEKDPKNLEEKIEEESQGGNEE